MAKIIKIDSGVVTVVKNDGETKQIYAVLIMGKK